MDPHPHVTGGLAPSGRGQGAVAPGAGGAAGAAALLCPRLLGRGPISAGVS